MNAAEGSIVVKAPVAAVYERWLAFEDYPKVMLRVPERRLAWRTLADHRAPDHFAAGVVSFASLSDRSTCVTLKLTSSFGGVVSDRVDRYLHNFKCLTEGVASPPTTI
jgi:uncharacterized membrane protein